MEILRGLGFMSYLNMGEIEKLLAKFKKVTFERGSQVLRQGNAGGALFFISQGSVDVLVKDRDAREVKVAILGPGDFCGEMALISGDARVATIVAAEDSEIFLLGKKAFQQILMGNAGIAQRINRIVEERTESTNAAFHPEAPAEPPVQKGWLFRALGKA